MTLDSVPLARTGARHVQGRDREEARGRFMIRNRTRVVQRHPQGDW
jgi:hypothetical protein